MKPLINWEMSRDYLSNELTFTFEFQKHAYNDALHGLLSSEIPLGNPHASEILLRLHQIAKYIEDRQANVIQPVTVKVIQPPSLPPTQ